MIAGATHFRERDPEWNATVHVLAVLDARGPGGLNAGGILGRCDALRREIDWDWLITRARVWSWGEQRVYDVAAAMWSGLTMAGPFDPRRGPDDSERKDRPLAPLADCWDSLDRDYFEAIITALRLRRGELHV